MRSINRHYQSIYLSVNDRRDVVENETTRVSSVPSDTWTRTCLPTTGASVRLSIRTASSCPIPRPTDRQPGRGPVFTRPKYTRSSVAVNHLMGRGNEVATLAVGGWAVTFGTARRGLSGATARPDPSSLYQMQQPTHQRPVYRSPSRFSAVYQCNSCATDYLSKTELVFRLPVTVLLYNGPLLCSFNVTIKG